MAKQPGLFGADERLQFLSAAGDLLERLWPVVDFELFRPDLEAALDRADRGRGRRPPYDAVPDAKTIWLFREQLTRAGALARLSARFDRLLHERGYLAVGGQIVDAAVVVALPCRTSPIVRPSIPWKISHHQNLGSNI
jgi:IS5 family transposase